MRIILIIFLIIVSRSKSFCQDSIFKKNRTFVYTAIFINSTQDTLTKETIKLIPTGQPWIIDKSQQAVDFLYSPNIEGLKKFVNPVNYRHKKRVKHPNWPWVIKSKTGITENENELWMHPFRANQYIYTEVAPFPEVRMHLSNPLKEWSSEIQIKKGWDNFEGKVESKYNLIDTNSVFLLNGKLIQNCWLFKSKAIHSVLGISKLDFVFHIKYGFVKLEYEFYDGSKIIFEIADIISNIDK